MGGSQSNIESYRDSSRKKKTILRRKTTMQMSKTTSKIISLCISMVLAFGVFAGIPITASAANAPLGLSLAKPADVKWEEMDYGSEYGNAKGYYATWSNLFSDDYAEYDYFIITLYNEAGDVVGFDDNWSKSSLENMHEQHGENGVLIYDTNGYVNDAFQLTTLPNGKYRFTVQAISFNPYQYQDSDVSDFSDWHEKGTTTTTPPTVNPPVVTPGGGSGGGSSSGSRGSSSSKGSSSTRDTYGTGTTNNTTTSTTINSSNISTTSRGSGETTVQAAAWKKLSGKSFQHSTVINGKTEVRITISNPSSINRDLKVSAYTTGSKVSSITNKFTKYFSNKVSVVHFDQTGSWGQEIRVAAKLDLKGMDTDNLVFYTYDSATNTYQRITAPNYSIDSNGFVHFSTSYAGSIVVSDGPLVKK